MSRRLPLGLVLAALVIANGYSGLAKIQAFRHAFRGSREVARADLNQAYASLKASLRWQPDNSTNNALLSKVVATAQANGLPLEGLAGRSTFEVLGVGVGAACRSIAVNPDDAWTWFNMAEVYLSFQRSRLRLDRMQRAGRAAGAGDPPAPPSPAPPEARGLQPEERIAVAAILKAREFEPNFYFYHGYLAGLYWERGLAADAGDEIRRAIALMPRLDLQPALEKPGMLAGLADQVLEGFALASKDPTFDPAETARARAEALQRLGRFDEGIEAAREFCRLGGDDSAPQCGITLGRLLVLRGDLQEAIEAFERAREADPDGELGITALYEQGHAHALKGNHAKSAELFKSLLSRQPGNLGGYLELAEQLDALGEADQAEAYLLAAVRKFPDALGAYERAIDYLRRRGKTEQAELYAQALLKRRSGSVRPGVPPRPAPRPPEPLP